MRSVFHFLCSLYSAFILFCSTSKNLAQGRRLGKFLWKRGPLKSPNYSNPLENLGLQSQAPSTDAEERDTAKTLESNGASRYGFFCFKIIFWIIFFAYFSVSFGAFCGHSFCHRHYYVSVVRIVCIQNGYPWYRSIVTFCMETIPELKPDGGTHREWSSPFFWIEFFCCLWFSIGMFSFAIKVYQYLWLQTSKNWELDS